MTSLSASRVVVVVTIACLLSWSLTPTPLLAEPQVIGADAELEAQTLAWHTERIRALSAPDGWLTLIGLHWLEEGDHTCGRAEGHPVRLPSEAIPDTLGHFSRRGDEVSFTPAEGIRVTLEGAPIDGTTPLAPDTSGAPTLLSHGSVSFYLISRADRLGIRVKDSASTLLHDFKGVERFPVSSQWVIEARLIPHDAPVEIAVPTAIGTVEMQPSPGHVEFEINGAIHRLDPVGEPGDTELFFIFSDATSGAESYGAGRFLPATLRDDNTLSLDFNRAYNPPCAFTPYATCPRPPRQNRLSVAVRAGEKRFH